MSENNQIINEDFQINIHQNNTDFYFTPRGVRINRHSDIVDDVDNFEAIIRLMSHLYPVRNEEYYERMEQKIMDQVMEESLQMYKTVEKKPDVKLDLENTTFEDCDSGGENPDKNCTICMMKYESDEIVTRLDCTHLFHSKCISEWGMYKAECPVCRAKIKTC